MPSRFDRVYRFDKRTILDQDTFDVRFRDLDDRITPLEDKRTDEETVYRSIEDRVLSRSEAVIQDLRARLVQITSLAWLVALSGTPATLTEGANVSLLILEEQRPLFAPGPFAIVSRTSTPDDFAVVRTLGFDRTLGQFDFKVLSSAGNPGPHADWMIAAVAGSTLAQLQLLDQGRGFRDDVVAAAVDVLGRYDLFDEARAIVEAGSLGALGYRRRTIPLVAGQSTYAVPGGYTLGQIDLFRGGVMLTPDQDFTATDGVNVTLAEPAVAGDVCRVVAYGPLRSTAVEMSDAIAQALAVKSGRGRRAVLDAAYAAQPADVYIGIASLTVSRTITLPPAASYPAGQPLYVADETGLCSPALMIAVAAAGGDTIAGQGSIALAAPYQKLAFHSNEANLWTYG